MRVSGSKLGLYMRCQYWARDDVEWPVETGSRPAMLGNWYHAVTQWTIDTANGIDRPKPEEPLNLGDANEWTPEADARALLTEYDGAKIRAEVAYAYDPVDSAVRFIGRDIGRNYGALDACEIPLTVDVEIVDGQTGIVVDWKTGRRENVTPAADNWQLRVGALAIAELHDLREVEVQLRFADGYIDKYTYSAFALMALEGELAEAVNRPKADPQPGIHCTKEYCPIRATCPATQAALTQLRVPEPTELADAATGGITTSEQAASLVHRVEAAEQLLAKVKQGINSWVDENGPIDLGSKEYRQVSRTNESIVAPTPQAIYEAISGYLSPEEFAELIKVSIPKGALEKAVKANTPKDKAKVWQSAMAELRAAGHTAQKTTQHYRVVQKRKAQ